MVVNPQIELWVVDFPASEHEHQGMKARPGTFKSYAKAVFVGFDVLVNALLGGRPYQTLSCRVGESIMDNGWAARVPWPRPCIDHFLRSVHEAIV